MLYIADNSDIQRHFNQVLDAGMIPPQLTLQSVSFEAGGAILVDAGIDAPWPIGELDVKLKLVIKLLSDKRTIRIRLTNIEFLEIGIRGAVMKLIGRLADQLVIPGLRAVRDKGDLYWEYTPMAWVLLQDILTQDNRLTIVADGVNIPLLVEETNKAKIAALDASPSMANKAETARLKAALVVPNPKPADEKTTPYPAPQVVGDINLKL